VSTPREFTSPGKSNSWEMHTVLPDIASKLNEYFQGKFETMVGGELGPGLVQKRKKRENKTFVSMSL